MRQVLVVLAVVWGTVGFAVASGGNALSQGVSAYWEADYDKAERILRTIDIWDLTDIEKVLLFKVLGATELAQGDSEAAKRAFVDLLEVDPTYELSSSDFSPTVVSVFREAQGELANVFYEQAMELYNDGDFVEAVAMFEKVLETDGNHPMAKEFLVIAKGRAGVTGATSGNKTEGLNSTVSTKPPITRVTPETYRLGTLEKGTQPWCDRPYVLRSIPADYRGAQSVMTANDDRENHGLNLSIDLERPATLYVAYDKRIKDKKKEAWLSSYVMTGRVITVAGPGASTETYDFEVYSRRVPAGLVSLGPNLTSKMKGGVGMYFVFAIPD